MSPQRIKQRPLTVSVVICTHNRPVLLERCLQALRRISQPVFSIYVVDNARNTDAAESLAAVYGAEYLVTAKKGLSLARNIGASVGQSDVVAYIDDDMVPDSDWLNRLLDEFAAEDIMGVTGPVLPLSLLRSDASDSERQLAVNTSWWPERFQLDKSSTQWFERTNFGGIGNANMAFRNNALQSFQGFEDILGRGAAINGGEEHYAFFCLVNAGFRIAYTPKAIVYHEDDVLNREHMRKLLVEGVAYSAFLSWRHPIYLPRIAKFWIEAAFRKQRVWRRRVDNDPLSLGDIASAIFRGLTMFWRAGSARRARF